MKKMVELFLPTQLLKSCNVVDCGNNFNTTGEVLQDAKVSGKKRQWKEKKFNSLKVSESYWRLGLDKKAERMRFCSSFLEFQECVDCGKYRKLIGASFCKDRLCPMCNWRRSGMLAKQILQILHCVQQCTELRYIFLTLTVKNCVGEDLSSSIDLLFKGYKRLFERKEVDDSVVGWVRCLEVTRNSKKRSKSYGTYHPHFHVLIGVKPSYFESDYIKQDRWVELWQKSLKIDYVPLVDIKVVKPKREGQTVEAATAETAKYTVKETDYILPRKKEMDSVIKTLAEALKNRRLVGYGKLFKDVKSKLKLRDIEAEDVDLIGDNKKQCNCPVCGGELEEVLYQWHMGYSDYLKVEMEG